MPAMRHRCLQTPLALSLTLATLGLLSFHAAAEPIPVGMSLPLTGTFSRYGAEMRKGAVACINAANQHGNDRRVELNIRDDRSDAAVTAANLESFVAANMIAALGPYGAEAGQAAVRVSTQHRFPVIGAATGAQSIRGNSKYLFHVRAGMSDEAVTVVNQFNSLGLDQVGVVYVGDAMGAEAVDAARVELARLAMPSYLTKVSSAERMPAAVSELALGQPQAVLVLLRGELASAFIKEVDRRKLRTNVVVISEAGADLFAGSLGAAGRGVGLSEVVPHPWSLNRGLVRDYQEAMRAAGEKQLSYFSLEGCIEAKVLLAGLRRIAGLPTREKLVQALESGEIDLGGYFVKYTAGDHTGSRFTELTVVDSNGNVRK